MRIFKKLFIKFHEIKYYITMNALWDFKYMKKIKIKPGPFRGIFFLIKKNFFNM